MFALDPNVAGQSAEPFGRETAPHRQSDQRRDRTNHHDEFSELARDSKSCAIQAKAQA
jgi:hypothetical protein